REPQLLLRAGLQVLFRQPRGGRTEQLDGSVDSGRGPGDWPERTLAGLQRLRPASQEPEWISSLVVLLHPAPSGESWCPLVGESESAICHGASPDVAGRAPARQLRP